MKGTPSTVIPILVTIFRYFSSLYILVLDSLSSINGDAGNIDTLVVINTGGYVHAYQP